jgi:hypothetical protein
MIEIDYLNDDLRELNARLAAALADSRELSLEEQRVCRWLALDIVEAVRGGNDDD